MKITNELFGWNVNLVFILYFFLVIQIMTSRPRSDLYINLPALRKLDNMLLVRFHLQLFLIPFSRFSNLFPHLMRSLVMQFPFRTGNIRQFYRDRVLVCWSRNPSLRGWWIILFPEAPSSPRREMVATSAQGSSWWPQWKFEEAVAAQTRLHKSNSKSCHGDKQCYFSWYGSPWVILWESSKGT